MSSNFEYKHEEFVTNPIAKISTQAPEGFAPNLNQGIIIMQTFVNDMIQAYSNQKLDENIDRGFILPDDTLPPEDQLLDTFADIDNDVINNEGERIMEQYLLGQVYSSRGEAYGAYNEFRKICRILEREKGNASYKMTDVDYIVSALVEDIQLPNISETILNSQRLPESLKLDESQLTCVCLSQALVYITGRN